MLIEAGADSQALTDAVHTPQKGAEDEFEWNGESIGDNFDPERQLRTIALLASLA